MFNKDFFPTSEKTIMQMVEGYDLTGKKILEPNGGSGNIVDFAIRNGAESVIACEINEDLRKILATKCQVIEHDFLKLTSDRISHIDMIIMNPPFSADEKHILHVWNIAPDGCQILALCNKSTLGNKFSSYRKKLYSIVQDHGSWEDFGTCFSTAQRKTKIEVACIRLQKPGQQQNEFEGFFMEEEVEQQANGIIQYNVVRDLVNRYVEAIKIFDQQLDNAVKMNDITGEFFDSNIALSMTIKDKPIKRQEFKKALQKSGWLWIFDKLNMQKYATKGLREDINKFVEKQENVPFTMRNIYKMLEIIVGTNSQRMDKALLEVFDKLTTHYDENRYYVEGWKTNSHYLVNKRFIMPGVCYQDIRWYKGQSNIQIDRHRGYELLDDMLKALCFLTGDNYDKIVDLYSIIKYEHKIYEGEKILFAANTIDEANERFKKYRSQGKHIKMVSYEPKYGEWFDWAYFRCRAYKKGTLHVEFKDENLWGKFNQHIAKLKGYPLYEAHPDKKTKVKNEQTAKRYRPQAA